MYLELDNIESIPIRRLWYGYRHAGCNIARERSIQCPYPQLQNWCFGCVLCVTCGSVLNLRNTVPLKDGRLQSTHSHYTVKSHCHV